MIAKVYTSENYRLPIVVTRFSNIYGPGQLNFSALIPDGIRLALRYLKFEPRGDGSMIRDFIFSEDVANLYLKIGEQLAKKPNKLTGEISHQYMDYEKVNEYFNWSPSHSLKDGLAKSIEWYDKWNQRK